MTTKLCVNCSGKYDPVYGFEVISSSQCLTCTKQWKLPNKKLPDNLTDNFSPSKITKKEILK